jgi:hypothetical protein
MLARRFRASFRATLRVAQPRAEGRARLKRRAVGQTLGEGLTAGDDGYDIIAANADRHASSIGYLCRCPRRKHEPLGCV